MSRIRGPAGPGSGENPLLGCVPTGQRAERGNKLSCGTNPGTRAPPSRPWLILMTPKALPPNSIILGKRISTYEF